MRKAYPAEERYRGKQMPVEHVRACYSLSSSLYHINVIDGSRQATSGWEGWGEISGKDD